MDPSGIGSGHRIKAMSLGAIPSGSSQALGEQRRTTMSGFKIFNSDISYVVQFNIRLAFLTRPTKTYESERSEASKTLVVNHAYKYYFRFN
jgi:hypothetical protein